MKNNYFTLITRNFSNNVLRIQLVLLFLFSGAKLVAQDANALKVWTDIPETEIVNKADRFTIPSAYRTLHINKIELQNQLASAPNEPANTADLRNGQLFYLPFPDGSFQKFQIFEYNVMHPDLAAKYPEIKTYTGVGLDDKSAKIKLDFTPHGFHALVLSPKGTIVIDPYSKGTTEEYISYDKKNAPSSSPFQCETSNEIISKKAIESNLTALRTSGANLRTYRLALACTGEYAAFHGGTTPLALAAMVTSVNRVNGVYESEVAIRLVLIANNNLLVYTNAATDPYTNNSGSTMLGENQNNLTTIIGTANFDIGHVFSTGGGGVAGLGVICNAGNKARGVTGMNAPIGDNFDIDYVAHEMGHQFGGNHTFNSVTGSCSGNRSTNSAYEPGSGITIMAYAGICGADDLAPHSIPYFSTRSFDEIVIYSTTSTGNTCPVTTATGNTAPNVTSMGANKSIPISTPFTLTGAGTDADNDPLTFSWEQFDLGTAGAWNANLASAPLFRPFSPTTSPSRTFPQISDIVNNVTSIGEILPNVARTLHFRLTARDNKSGGAGVMHPDTTLSINVVNNGGAFAVTAPNTAVSWIGNSTQTVTWNVSGTTAAPISTANVNILLSTDGGFTYPTLVLANTPNDGSQIITVPNSPTTTARIKVEAVDNVYFDISNTNFTITAPTIPDYTLSVTPGTQNVCVNVAAVYTINTSSILGYTGAITLTASSLPPGASALFSPNPITPGASSTLTLSNLTLGGAYTFNVDAASASSNKNFSTGLTVFDSPGNFSLQTPANNATGQSVLPTLTWTSSANALSYDLEIATNAGFTIGLQTFNGINTNSYTLASSLSSSTVYFWRVRAVNSCFTGNFSSGFSFTTSNVYCTTFNSTNIPLAISATGAPTITSNLVIPFTGTISDINLVNVTGTHSWINDLTFTLRSPGAVNDIVLQNICASEDNFNVNFDDEAANLYTALPCPPTSGLFYKPKNPLSIYDGTALSGTWQLIVNDIADQDGGSLATWGLNVCYTPICNLLVNVTPVNASCPAVCDGTASAVISNGIAPYVYAWSNGQSSATASGLCVQNYSLTVSDAQGCSVSQNFSVGTNGSVPSQPASFTASTSSVCVGQTNVTYTVPSVAGVTYTWSYSGTGASISGTGNSISIDFSLSATSGDLTVTPSNACGNGIALQMSITVSSGINWYLDADLDGYYTGSPIASCSSPGSGYTSVLPPNGSGDCDDANINVHAFPAASTISANGPLTFCEGESVTLLGNTSGGEWNTTETSNAINVISSGTYFVINSNSCGNTNSNSIVVTVTPASIAPVGVTAASPYNYGFENATPPAVFCGMIISNDNFPADIEKWHTSTQAPHSGNNHMAINANADGVSAKEDWFFTAPLTLLAGKSYRISFWYRSTNAAKLEKLQVFTGLLADAANMQINAPLYSKNNIQNTSYSIDSSSAFIPSFSGTYYFGFHAFSAANQANLFVDDIQVKEVSTTNLNPIYCTTIPSLYSQIFVQPVPGASNYRFKIVGSGAQASYNYEHYRNNANPDYRLKWAPGVIYGYTYDVSVAYFKNGVWSPYGASCPVSLGAFPTIKLRNNPLTPGQCNYTISDLNAQLFTDSLSGANDYMYKIVENNSGNSYNYDHTWQRYSGNLDYRLVWAYQTSPLIDRVRFGYKYDVQTRALVGKTNAAFGNRPGEWGNYGATCELDLSTNSPTTSLSNCNILLSSLNQQIFTTPVNGATNYEYEFTAPGYTAVVYRGNGNTDFRLIWIPTSPAVPGGPRYATTYSVRVKPYVGGVWLNYGAACTVTTPAAPSTTILGICGTTLSSGQFSSTISCTAVPGASMYSYRITNVGGVAYSKVFYNFNPNNTFSLARTLACCGQQNLLPNATYTIEVAYYAGVWSAYGPACTFTTGTTVPRYSPFESNSVTIDENSFNLSIYPNPSLASEGISIELNSTNFKNQEAELVIYSAMGKKVYNNSFMITEGSSFAYQPNIRLAAGVYMAEVHILESVHYQKFVVK
ncbi:MAG: T9SS type A sorting domain-containing protein [Bacteroidetes bacterium]|nr:T9SS type A sorting domain-containing protein [Bacteroidota bacterium]